MSDSGDVSEAVGGARGSDGGWCVGASGLCESAGGARWAGVGGPILAGNVVFYVVLRSRLS